MGCNRKRSAHAYHLSLNVYFFADRQSGALYCAADGRKFIHRRNVAKLYYDSTNPDFPTSMHLDRQGNLLLMYTDIDRYEIGRIQRREMRTSLVKCKASVVKGTPCDTNTSNRKRVREMQNDSYHQREDVYEEDDDLLI